MPISDKQREFWNTKDPSEQFDVIVFEHSRFAEPIRLVLNQYTSMIFNGEEYIPAAGKLEKPNQEADLIPTATLQFPRIHIGDIFKQYTQIISAFGWNESITMRLMEFTELDMNTPTKSWTLYVAPDGIRLSKTTVQIKATDYNPMSLNISTIYTIEEYKGLARV
ncbi:hypothetical protein RHO15_09575 [Utexia brackfieldae]|uniref:hypothetical protein n=1 Tax=Utexia brackfieldae TaxID=3074108 RepID=UPI00370DDA48